MRSSWAAVAAVLVMGGCGVRLGGPGPQQYTALALPAIDVPAAQAVTQITESGANVVLVANRAEASWFEAVAEGTGLGLSGPGRTGSYSLAFLTNLELLGDTALVLGTPSGGRLHLQDALYKVDENRVLDLMLLEITDGVDLRESVRTLLSYIATDVGADAAVLLGVTAPAPAVRDSVVVLLRAAFGNAWECTDAGRARSPAPRMDVRLFYGPEVRLDCNTARVLDRPGGPIVAEVVVR